MENEGGGPVLDVTGLNTVLDGTDAYGGTFFAMLTVGGKSGADMAAQKIAELRMTSFYCVRKPRIFIVSVSVCKVFS